MITPQTKKEKKKIRVLHVFFLVYSLNELILIESTRK